MHASSPLKPEYPQAASFMAAAPENYRRWHGAAPRPVARIVIHITDGHEDLARPVARFQQAGVKASPHYIVGQDGTVVQMVRHDDIAWHASEANATSIGIEHVARSPGELGPKDPGLPLREAQYAASARLVRWLCERYHLPIDRSTIVGHCEAAKTSHSDCPNRIWDWGAYMQRVQQAGDGSVP